MVAVTAPTFVHDRTLIESISTPLWRQMFETFGYPEGLGAGDLQHESIAAVIGANTAIAPELLESLQNVHDLGDDAGREALFDAAHEGGVDLSDLRDASPIDAAVHAVTRAHASTDLTRVIRFALVTIHERRSPNAVKEFSGTSPRSFELKKINAVALERELTAWFESLGMGTHAEVHVVGRVDGGLAILILHGHRKLSQLVVDEGEGGRHVIEYRPALCDVLRYDPDSGRLRITARSDRLVQKYRDIAGAALVEDQSWFGGETMWDLRPLAEGGREGLVIDPARHPEIESVELVELLWVTPRGNKVILRGDVFEEAEAQSLRLLEGDLVEAKLRVRFHCEPPNRATVAIRAPNHAKISPRFDAPVLSLLSDLGVRRQPGSARHRELWRLAGGPRPKDDWKTAYGSDLDAMLREGVVARASLKVIEHPDHPGERGALDVRHVEDVDGRRIAFGVGAGVPSRRLTSSDLEGLRLDERRLADLVAAELGATGPVVETLVDGTYALGPLMIGSESIRPFLVLREPSADIPRLIKVTTVRGSPVLLVPVGCTTDSGLPEVVLHNHAPPFEPGLIGSIVETLGLSEGIEAIHRAPRGTKLVVDCDSRRAWLEGELLSEVLDDQRFRWLELVAYGAFMRLPLTTSDLDAALSRGPDAAKRVKLDLRKAIVKSFEANGTDVPDVVKKDLFPSLGGKLGYGVSVSVWVQGKPVSWR